MISDFHQIKSSLLEEVIQRRAPLPNKTTDKMTVFLEPDNFLWRILSPDKVEGFIQYPGKKCDLYFNMNDADGEE